MRPLRRSDARPAWCSAEVRSWARPVFRRAAAICQLLGEDQTVDVDKIKRGERVTDPDKIINAQMAADAA